jgi:hypothetical protein
LASSYGPHDPKLYWRLFEPEEIDGEQYIPGAGKILQPTSIEEFEAMLDMWDSEAGLNDMADLFESFGLGDQALE